MRLLLIADTYPPARISGALQMRDLAHALARQGHRPLVLVPATNEALPGLDAMDGVQEFSSLPERPRPINAYGYPLEGIKTRFVEIDGAPYLYVVNLRKAPINCFLSGGMQVGRDLLRGHEVAFPTYLEPLHPMLVKLDANIHRTTAVPVAEKKRRH